jgi:hypothetical protein
MLNSSHSRPKVRLIQERPENDRVGGRKPENPFGKVKISGGYLKPKRFEPRILKVCYVCARFVFCLCGGCFMTFSWFWRVRVVIFVTSLE